MRKTSVRYGRRMSMAQAKKFARKLARKANSACGLFRELLCVIENGDEKFIRIALAGLPEITL